MIGLVLGILPVALLPRLPAPWVPLALAGSGLVLLAWRGALPRLTSGLALGAALALVHGQLLLERRISDSCVGEPLLLTGEIASLPRDTLCPDGRGRQRFEVAVAALEPRRCAGPRRVLLSYYGPAKITPGDRWTFPVKLARPWGLANPGSFNLQAWYAQTGIDAVGSVRGGAAASLAVRHSEGADLTSLPNRLRQQISERIASLPLTPEAAALLRAVTVADKSGIDAPFWTLLQQFGINHLLVISGLHVGLVAGAAYLLGGALQRLCLLAGRPAHALPAILALFCCCAYTALAGFSVATQRALCMLACFLVADLTGRSSSPGNNLLLAAALVLVINPLAALGSGFWLSFSAVAALLWLARWQRGWRSWRRALSTHGFMSLVMLPLGAWWFGGSSVVAGLANLVMVPLVGLVVVPLALLAVVCMYLIPIAELPLWRLAAWPLQQVLPLARTLARDSNWFYLQFHGSLADVLLAAIGILLVILPLPVRARALALLMLLPLLLPPDYQAAFPSRAEPPGMTRVTVLDVGQGTAVVVRSGPRVLVYDTGGGDPAGANMAEMVVLPYLRQHGAVAVDTLVISHPDNDHSAGAATLAAAMPPARVYFGGDRVATTGARPCLAGQAWRWPGGQQFQFLSPLPAPTWSGPSNDSSCVLQIEAAGFRLLLLGDVESPQERELARYWGSRLASDWLLVAHHGSRTSSSWALLKVVRPSIAVVSSGYANRFGHPHDDVVARLGQAGARIYGTARGGALEFEFAPGQPVQVRRRRQEHRRFWM